MWPTATTRKDELRSTFEDIRDEVLRFVNSARKYRHWTFEELATKSGTEVDDWKCDGWIRRMMYGRKGRRWLREDYRLWWTAEKEHHCGLLFTADCRTGAEWARSDAAEDIHSIGLGLEEAMEAAERLQPTFRSHFRKIKSAARKIIQGGVQLKGLGSERLLEAIGVNGSNGANGRQS